MGLTNCKCAQEEVHSVPADLPQLEQTPSTPTPLPPSKKFSDLIPEHREDLAISAKAVWDSLPAFIYARAEEEILSWEEVKLEDGVYLGEVCEGEPHGRGFEMLKDGSLIEAHWENGMLTGRGRMIFSNGDYFTGDFYNGKLDGKGILVSIAGAKYEGTWANSKQEGLGKELWPDGSEFIGEYKNGVKSGKGTFWWKDGSVYEGEFCNNVLHGRGVYEWSDGRRYEGEYLDDKRSISA